MEPSDIIIRPVSSESALEKVEKENKILFIVDPKSNKIQIKQAVEKLYGVKVKSVNTMITPPRRRPRSCSRRNSARRSWRRR